jgi:exodeoxyribonuclease VII small subunit
MTDSKSDSESAKSELSFEDALRQLEEIVQRLENEDVPLEESVNLYEQGMELSKYCADTLEEAEQRIEKVNEKLEEDHPSSPNE